MSKVGYWALVGVTLVILASCVCSAGCTPQGQSYSVFGLGSVLQVVDYARNAELEAYCRTLVAEVQRAVNVTDDASDVARFNAAADEETVPVSALTYDVMTKAREAYDLTQGLYDPTVYWLVDLWGFLPRKEGATAPYDRAKTEDGALPLPDERYVAAFRQLTDMRKIEQIHTEGTDDYALVKHGTATTVEGVTYYARVDLGGIAKGYVVDRIRDYCRAHGVDKGYMSFGASSLLLLKNRKGAAWDLSLTHPRGTETNPTYCTLPAMDLTASTSGDYQNYYMVDGVRYSHLVNPTTGRPAGGDLLSVTVLSPNACMGDALSTALTVGGLDRLKAFATGEYAKVNGIRVVAVYRTDDGLAVYSTADDLSVHLE